MNLPYKTLVIIGVISIAISAYPRTTSITINTNIEYQTIDNFGASDCWSMQKIGAWDLSKKERIADLLFSESKGIGLSCWRFNIGAGINHTTIKHPWRTAETFEVAQGQYDWSRQANERWFLQAASHRGVDQFIAFVNSPPARMTRNGYTNCTDGLGSTNLKEGYEDQFATYLVDILKHFRNEEEINFDFLSPVNEPNYEWNSRSQEGNRASNEDIKDIINALYEELNEQGVETEIQIPESGKLELWYRYSGDITDKYGEPYGNYLDEFLGDSSINYKISNRICGHSYGSDLVSSKLVQDRMRLKKELLPYQDKDWKYWVTEYCVMEGPYGKGGHGRDLTINKALNVARVIHYDLTLLNASAWQWWTAVSPEDYKDGLIYTSYFSPGDPQTIYPSKTLWAFGNFSRYVRPGAKRIGLIGADNIDGLLGSAYKDKANDKIIIVIINMGYSSENVSLTFKGLDSVGNSENLTSFVTSGKDGDNLKEYPFLGIVPARSVVTIVGGLKELSKIRVVPNPYSVEAEKLQYPGEPDKIMFVNLPPVCTIKIYTESGDLINTLQHTDGSGNEAWVDPTGQYYQVTSSTQIPASGLYFAHIVTPDGRSTNVKFVIVR